MGDSKIESVTIAGMTVKVSHRDGDGGDVIMSAGVRRLTGKEEAHLGEFSGPIRDGRVVFRLADGSEVMLFEPDGSITVRGEVVDNNAAVYRTFRRWLRDAIVTWGDGDVTASTGHRKPDASTDTPTDDGCTGCADCGAV